MSESMKADTASYHIEGIARAARERGQSGRFDVPLISHIVGNLWMGGCIDGVPLDDDFQYVLSLYPWEQYRISGGTYREEIRLYDAGSMPDPDDLQLAVDLATDMVSDGKTLVHCQAGLNRSGLVSALVMMRSGYTGKQAIDVLRAHRHPVVLCNATFEAHLLGLDLS